jgi:hypothetical protein
MYGGTGFKTVLGENAKTGGELQGGVNAHIRATHCDSAGNNTVSTTKSGRGYSLVPGKESFYHETKVHLHCRGHLRETANHAV